jgi:hypothetical protein
MADADGPRLRVENPAEAKTYTLRLRQADGDGGARFRHEGVPLAAGATHTVRPDWSALGDGPVEVDVDLNGDGIPDDVLVLEHQPVAAEPDAPAGLPQVFALHPPSPNPFAARIRIVYDMPEAAHVRLVVYDLVGREVAVLVDGLQSAGEHTAVLDGRSLPSGTFLVKLTTPDGFEQIRRVTRLR